MKKSSILVRKRYKIGARTLFFLSIWCENVEIWCEIESWPLHKFPKELHCTVNDIFWIFLIFKGTYHYLPKLGIELRINIFNCWLKLDFLFQDSYQTVWEQYSERRSLGLTANNREELRCSGLQQVRWDDQDKSVPSHAWAWSQG